MYTPGNKPPLSITHPNLVTEWDYNKNNSLGIYPDQITYGITKKVWWICKHGHEWQSTINSRTNKSQPCGCPVCAGKKVLAGFNDLATVNPQIASEWHPTKNGNLNPTQVTVSSHKKVWWLCEHGHEWYASIGSRTNKSHQNGCPVCAGQKVLAGFNDLATLNPKLALEWHPTKNGNLNPTQVTVSSQKKVWWICKYGHEWQSTIASRTNMQSGCPVCAGKTVVIGFNDLATVNPNLALEWHPTKNGNLKPTQVTVSSHKKVWWLCEHGHEWQASINSRTNMQSGCPVCSGRQVLVGFNDLATVNPNLALEWHPTKNGDLKPSDVTQGTDRKVWWICEHGHDWHASIAHRTNTFHQNGCPVCARLATVSYPESIVSYYMQSLGTPCILQASNASIPQLENMSVDLYLPAYDLAIEYDGSFYHPEGVERKQRDYKKDAALSASSVNLIRIRDDVMLKKPFTCTHLKHYISYRYSCKNQEYENLQFVIQDIITNCLKMNIILDFDLGRDKNKIIEIKDTLNFLNQKL